MRLNEQMINVDMFEEVVLPGCPQAVRKYAERLLRLIANLGEFHGYRSVSELDKILMVEYWSAYDQRDIENFAEWFIKKATNPDFISRARRWLKENGYIIIDEKVADGAQDESEHWRGSIGQAGKQKQD